MNGDFETFRQMPHGITGTFFVPTLDKQGYLYKDRAYMLASNPEGVPSQLVGAGGSGQLLFLMNGVTNTDFYWRTTDEWGTFQVFPQNPVASNILETFTVDDVTLPTVTFKTGSDRPQNYLVELNCWNTSSIYQDVATVPGKIYEWSFDYVRRGGGGGTVAVVIGESINTADDYTNNGYATNRFNKTLDSSNALVNVPAAQIAIGGEWAYGHKDATLFRDIVREAVEDYDTSSYADENAFLTAHPEAIGRQLVATYGNKNWSVMFLNTSNGAADSHVPYSGVYSVPAGQGETVFGFVSIAPPGASGNQLDNIAFASGSEPASSENITYVGDTSLATTTQAGYAYALAEVRGSTVINLSGLSATFNGTATSPNASLGTGSWYTPNAAGTLTFTGLTPGKTYRVIGIPQGSISAGLGTNLSPADVLDAGYYQDTIMLSASVGTTTTLPSVTYEYNGGGAGTVTASIANTKTDVEYAILADDGTGNANAGKPVTSGPALSGTPTTAWTPGKIGSLEFSGLDPATRYFLVTRALGYTEVSYASAAFNTDNTVAALALKTPVTGAVDIAPGTITATSSGSSITIDTTNGYTYRLVDPDTGDFVGNPISGNGSSQTFSGYTSVAGKTYQVVARAPGDTSWMRGVRLYPYPDELFIDFADESISDTGTAAGTVAANIEYTIQNYDNSYLAGDNNTWAQASGTSAIDLDALAQGSAVSILDSIPSSPSASATLMYRQSGTADNYTGASYHLSRTLVIPPRPAAPASKTGYLINYPAETVSAVSGTLEVAPHHTTARTDVASGSFSNFTTFGWTGAADFDIDVRTKATSVAFASRSASDTIKARPPAPLYWASYSLQDETLTVTMTGHRPEVFYQSRLGTDPWQDVAFSASGVSDPWLFDDTARDYEVRIKATDAAPASYAATVSAPIILGPVNMDPNPWPGPATPPSSPVSITNIYTTPVENISLQLEDSTYFTLVGTSPFDVAGSTAPGGYTDTTSFTVTPKPGLDAGVYTTYLVATYTLGGASRTTKSEVTLTIEKIPWDISALTPSTSSVSATSLNLDVTGAPLGSYLAYRTTSSGAWNALSTPIGSGRQVSVPLSGLSAATTYTLFVKAQGDTNHYESASVQTDAWTAYATPVFDDVLVVDYRGEVLRFKDGYNQADYEVRINGNVIDSPNLSSLTTYANGADFTISVAHKQGLSPHPYPASASVSKTITSRSPAPAGITVTNASSTQANDGALLLSGAFEYRAHQDASQAAGWAAALNTAAATYGTYDVRRPATDAAFASASQVLTVSVAGVYMVTYTAAGGVGAPVQTDGTAGVGNAFRTNDPVDVLGPGAMTRGGSVFVGWDVSPDITFAGLANTIFISAADAATNKTFPITANTTLSAAWEAKPTVASVTPTGLGAPAPAGTITLTFSDDMSPTPGTITLTASGGTTISATNITQSSTDPKVFSASYSALAYQTSYTYTISGFTKATSATVPVAMDTDSAHTLSTQADTTRSITSIAQFGGTNGKVRSTGIMVTFSGAVTTPPLSAFTLSGSTALSVSDGADSNPATWAVLFTGNWANGANPVSLAVSADWGGWDIVGKNTAQSPQLYAPEPIAFTAPLIDYQAETLTGLIPERSYNYRYGSPQLTGSFTTGASQTTYPVAEVWMTGVPDGFEIQRVATDAEPNVDSAWVSLTIPARRLASVVGAALAISSHQLSNSGVEGQIAQLTSSMQYKTATGAWKTFAGTGSYTSDPSILEAPAAITNLLPGTYYVRMNYSTSPGQFVSNAQHFTIHSYGAISFDEVDEGYSAGSLPTDDVAPINVQDALNEYFPSAADKITVTDVTLEASSDFISANTANLTTLIPKGGLVPGIYYEPVTVARTGTAASSTMVPRIQMTVNGLAAFADTGGASTNGSASAVSTILTVCFKYPVVGLDSSSFVISGAALQDPSPSVTHNVDSTEYYIAITPASSSTRDGDTIGISVVLPTTPSSATPITMPDIYAHQKTVSSPMISTTTSIRVPRKILETSTFNTTGYATSFIQFTLAKPPAYYPTPGLQNMVGEVSVLPDLTSATPGSATVTRVVQVDASADNGEYYTYRAYLSGVSGGDVLLHFNTFISLNTGDTITLDSGKTPGSRNYFLELSSGTVPDTYQNIPTNLDDGAQVLPDAVATTSVMLAPAQRLLTSFDLATNSKVTAVFLDGVLLDAHLWSADVDSSLYYSYDGASPITVASPFVLTLEEGFAVSNGTYRLEVVFEDDSYLLGAIEVKGLLSVYDIALSETATYDFADSYHVGYTIPEGVPITITNTGNRPTGPLFVSLGATSGSSFTLSTATVADIAYNTSASDAFSIQPKGGLLRGTYSDTVTVSGAFGISKTFSVRFVVRNSAPIVISGQEMQTGTARPASAGGTQGALPYTADVSQYFDDADSDTLSYAVVSSAFTGAVSLDADTGALSFIPHASDAEMTATITVRASDAYGALSSDVTITIDVGAIGPAIDQQPVSAEYWTDTPASSVADLSVGLTGQVGTVGYQWYENSSASAQGGSPIAGATGGTYTPDVSVAAVRYYYVIITTTAANGGPASQVSSAVATITSTERPANAVAPTFKAHPATTTSYLTTGDTPDPLDFTLNPNGNGTLSYRWYTNTTASTTGGTPITGATGTTYTPDISAASTQYFYVVVTASVPNAVIPLASRASEVAQITSSNRRYTVQFDIGYGAPYGHDVSGEAPDSISADINTTTILPTNTSNTGRADFFRLYYTFAGWDTIAGGTESGLVGNTHYGVGAPYSASSDSAPTTLYAAWVENLALIFDTDGGTSIAGIHVDTSSGPPASYGAIPSWPTDPTRPGYSFAGWYLVEVDGVSVSPSLVNLTDPLVYNTGQSITLKAHWIEDAAVGIDFVAGEGGTILPAESVLVPPASGSVSARTAITNAGYTFTSWTDSSGAIVSLNPVFTPLKTGGLWVAETYRANFSPIRITVNLNATEGTVIGPSTLYVDFNDTFGTLPPAGRLGYAFVGWYSAPTGGYPITELTRLTDPTVIQMLYARWNREIYPVIEHFGEYHGSGTSFSRIDHEEYDEFMSLVVNETGIEVAPSSYDISAGSTRITLAEPYVQTLATGTHYFTAEFAHGASEPIMLVVIAPDTGDGSDTAPDSADSGAKLAATGDATPFGLVVALVALGLVALTASFISRRHSRQSKARASHAR
jgi:uncharacterized repeat protein (TIGR02543 family)